MKKIPSYVSVEAKMTTVQTKVLFCIFIDNKTTDGDLVDSRRHGAVLLWVSSDPMCKQDGITI